MVFLMRDNTNRERNKEKVFTNGRMVPYMREDLKKINSKVMAKLFSKIFHTKVSGKMV